jgi:hypothetical protein
MANIKRTLRARRPTRGLTGALLGLALLVGLYAGVQHLVRTDASADPANDLNWAVGASTSMTPSLYVAYPSSLAVDGKTTTSAITGARSGVQPFLQIDLESATRVRTVRVVGTGTDVRLITGDERGIPGSTVAQATGQPGVAIRTIAPTTVGVTVTVDADVRYLRVQSATAATSLTVTELEARTDPGYVYVVDPGEQTARTGQAITVRPTVYSPNPVTWSAVGLPGGFSIDAATGTITGAPRTTGRWKVELTATDPGLGRRHTAKFDIVGLLGASTGPVKEHPALDAATLSNRPTQSWGVIGANASTRISGGNPADTSRSLDVTVWDLQQIGEWMYVGGEFNRVMAPDGTTYPQAHLARFAVATGVWDSSWRPVLNGNVHALEVNDDGLLLVGGEFTSIDGTAGTAALAAIDPATGRVDTTRFTTRVERRLSSLAPVVRELEVVGTHLYIGGKFSHVSSHGGAATRVYSAARVTNRSGTVDPTWLPRVTGGSVWGIGVDTTTNLVHLAGWFSSIDGKPGTARLGTVTMESGAVANTTALPRNGSQLDVYDVEATPGRMWMAGSEHVLVVWDALSRRAIAWNAAGNGCPDQAVTRWCGNGLGGDFQFAEKIGDFVYAGCHCNRPVSNAHWSSVSRRYTNHITVNAYRVADGGLEEAWNADVGGGVDGGWTAATDTRGCLWIGGDIVDGGFREPGGRVFARGFARFCATGAPAAPTGLTGVSATTSVTLTWNQTPTPNLRATIVYRDGIPVTEVPAGTTTWTDTGRTAGAVHVYEVRTEDTQGRSSFDNPSVTVTVGGSDLEPPTVPAGLTGTAGADSVTLSWDASIDDRGVDSYLVFRNGAYVGWTRATTYTDAGLAPAAYAYTLRAVDGAGNRSDPTGAVTVQVGTVDTAAPSVPTDLAGTAGPDSVTLTWTAATDDRGVTGYLVYRNGSYQGFTTSTTFTGSGLTPGSYAFEVRAVDAAGNRSDKTPPVTVQVGAADTTPPGVPSDLVATGGVGQVTLSWTAATDDRAVTGYLVYRDGAYRGWSTSTTFTDTGLTPGTYTYELRAQDAAGNRSDKTPPVSGTAG